MTLEDKLDQISKLSKKIKAQEPRASTNHERQAEITMAELEKTVQDLIREHRPIKVVFLSLFYFWLMLEAPLRRVSEKQVKEWPLPLPEALEKIICVIRETVDRLPDHKPTHDMQALGKNINHLKSYLSDDVFNHPLLPNELVKQTEAINTRIHTVTSNLLRKSFHPEIISNVLFGCWVRLLNLHASIGESYHQKMEFYFTEIIEAARKEVPRLFQEPG